MGEVGIGLSKLSNTAGFDEGTLYVTNADFSIYYG
jgi:hypothetical protein